MLLSSTSYITAAFTLASRYPGLEIKILYYYTLYSTIKYTKAQSLVEDAHTRQYMPDTGTYVTDRRMHVCLFESSRLEGSYVGDLTILSLTWSSPLRCQAEGTSPSGTGISSRVYADTE